MGEEQLLCVGTVGVVYLLFSSRLQSKEDNGYCGGGQSGVCMWIWRGQ